MTITTSASQDFVRELGQLLVNVGAHATVTPARLAPSTLHDMTYHLAMVACAIQTHAAGDPVRILAPWLKLIQFVAARPSLVPKLKSYQTARRERDRDNWSLMPRGYLGDETHDSVVELLVAASVLKRDDDYLVESESFNYLTSLASGIAKADLFSRERAIIEELNGLRPSRSMLGGT